MSTRFSSALAVSALICSGALFAPSQALAGPNAGGTLILHSPEIITCFDGGALGTPPPCELVAGVPLLDCQSAVTNGQTNQPLYLVVYAAFPAANSPRLQGVTFGIFYSSNSVFVLATEGCGDFELSNQDWPAAGSGTAVTWNTPQLEHLVQIYVFAAYEYYGLDTSFDLIQHPTGGSIFADDSVPSLLDQVEDFGRFGFNNDPGYLPCPPGGDPVGACCIDPNCVCLVRTRTQCDDEGGSYLGDDTSCDPNPCACITGACCLPEGTCVDMLMIDCEQAGGTWLGEGTDCNPDPCEPTPTLETSWGRIKTTYR